MSTGRGVVTRAADALVLSRLSPSAAALVALLAGALLVPGFAPFGLWPVVLVSLGTLYLLVVNAGPAGALWRGWWFGLGQYGAGTSWVYVSIHQFGNAGIPLAVLMTLLFAAGLALFVMLTMFLWRRLVVVGSAWPDVVSFAAAWTLMDWLLTWVLTGFPWLFPGYAFIDTPLAPLAPLVGVLGITWVVVMMGAALGALIVGLRGRLALGAVLLLPWPVGWLAGQVQWTTPDPVPRSVALVQGNTDQATKWQRDQVTVILQNYAQLSEPYWGADLVIWPEAAITLYLRQAREALRRLAMRAGDGTLITGIPVWNPDPDASGGRFRNAAVAVGSGSGIYYKRRLVPFGEYVPLEGVLRGLIDLFDLPMSRAGAGPWQQPPLDGGGFPVAVAICYEIAYPRLVADSDGAVIVTLSNDTWFGNSIGPHQHLEMARMRALENGRWVLRATNNGITAVIDARGEIVARLPQFRAGVLTAPFRLVTGDTPWRRVGDVPVLLLCCAALLLGGSQARARSRSVSS